MGSNLPVQYIHMQVLYRQTFNTYGNITTDGLTQDNRVGNTQKVANTQLSAIGNVNKGILAGSVVAVVGEGQIGPAAGDSSHYDKVVGVAVNDALGMPYEASSAVSSERVVYMHGTGTVFSTDIYETAGTTGAALGTAYAAGQLVYASKNGLLCNAAGLCIANLVGSQTVVGIILKAPTATDKYMTVQLFI